MALIETGSNGNGIFLQPFMGKISAKSKEQKDGYALKIYVLPNGVTAQAWVKTYQSISGKLRKVQYREAEHEGNKIQSWKIILDDGENIINFEFGATTNVARSWLRITPNIDLEKDIELNCFADKQNEKKTVLVVRQGGETVKFAYTKDSPNGIPQPKMRATGKWDFGDADEWLHEKNLEFSEKVSRENPNFGQSEFKAFATENDGQQQIIPKFPKILTGDQYRNREGNLLTVQFSDNDEVSFYSTMKEGLHKLSATQWSEIILPKYTLQERIIEDMGEDDLPF